MAYKFQSGASIASGSLVQEGLLDIKGSLQISGSSAIDASRNFAGGSATFTGDVSSSSDLTLGAGQDVKFGGTDVLNLTSLGSTVLASSLTSVGTLSSLNVGNVTSTGILSGTTATLAVGGAVSIGGASVLNATTLGSTVLASSLTSVGTLSSLGVGAVTSTGIVSSSNDGRFLALDINGNEDIIDSSANFSGGSVTAQLKISSSAGISGSSGKFLGLMSASHFVGNGAGLSNVEAVTAITSSTGDVNYELAFTEYLGSDVELAVNAGLYFNPKGTTTGHSASLYVSGTYAGRQSSSLNLQDVVRFGTVWSDDDSAYMTTLTAQGAMDVSGSGLVFYGGVGAEQGIDLIADGAKGGIRVCPTEEDDPTFHISASSGLISSSAGLELGPGAAVKIAGSNVLNRGTLGSTVLASSLTSVGTLSSLGVGAITSTGVVSSSNDGRFLALDINSNANVIDSSANFAGATISGSGDLTLGAGSDMQIGGTDVLSATTLGSTVLASSLTSLGTQGEALNMGGYGISNVGGLTSSLGVRVQGYGLFVSDLTRSAGDMNIKLHDASANNVGFRLASGTKPLVVYSTNYVGVTSLTASSGVQFDSTVQLDGAGDVSASIQADSVYFRDASTGLIKRDSFVDIVSAIAGAGITATGGVLSTQAQSVTSGSNAFGAVTLVEGYNYFGDVTGTMVATLPSSPTVGDIVNVKAKSISSSKSIKITGSAAHTIDGDGYINIESSYGAVGLVYVASNDWRVV